MIGSLLPLCKIVSQALVPACCRRRSTSLFAWARRAASADSNAVSLALWLKGVGKWHARTCSGRLSDGEACWQRCGMKRLALQLLPCDMASSTAAATWWHGHRGSRAHLYDVWHARRARHSSRPSCSSLSDHTPTDCRTGHRSVRQRFDMCVCSSVCEVTIHRRVGTVRRTRHRAPTAPPLECFTK